MTGIVEEHHIEPIRKSRRLTSLQETPVKHKRYSDDELESVTPKRATASTPSTPKTTKT